MTAETRIVGYDTTRYHDIQVESNASFQHAKVGDVVNVTNSVSKAGPLPNWRSLISTGQNATTSMSGSETVVALEPGSCYWERRHRFSPYPTGYRKYSAYGQLTGIGVPAMVLDRSESTADNRALSKYYSNLAAVETKFKGLVFAGELKESLAMIRHPAAALRRGISNYLSTAKRRGRKAKKTRRESVVRATWLEYSFGWRPLINDIDSAITAFYSSDSVRPIFEMVKGSGRDKGVVNDTSYQLSNGPLIWSLRKLTTEEVFVQYYGIYQSRGSGVPNLHTYGFRPAEFVPTLWELIPYSFLVDYFSNIGEIVSSWSYRTIGTNWTARLIRREGVIKSYQSNVDHFNTQDGTYNYEQRGSVGSQTNTYKSFVRTPSVTPGLPSLELQVPGKWTQWANLSALSAAHQSASRALRT